MRLRSSGGWSFDHSGFGTEPNIEPPSSHRNPVSIALARQPPNRSSRIGAEWPKARAPVKPQSERAGVWNAGPSRAKRQDSAHRDREHLRELNAPRIRAAAAGRKHAAIRRFL